MKTRLLSLTAATALSVFSAASFADSAVMSDVSQGFEAQTGKEIYEGLHTVFWH